MIVIHDLFNLQERLEDIEKDQREYTLDEEDQKMQTVILKREPSTHETMVLKKQLSTTYPNMCFNEALRQESQKLRLELQRSQANLDVGQCEVIQRLLEVTEAVVTTSEPEKAPAVKAPKKVERNYSDASDEKGNSYKVTSTNARLYSFVLVYRCSI